VDYGISNVLQLLMFSDVVTNTGNREYHELYDDRYLQVLIQLRKMGLLKKEDIQRYDLLSYSCAEKRFRYLVEWDPSALLHPISHEVYQFITLHTVIPFEDFGLYLRR
jgi:hypothetical protein